MRAHLIPGHYVIEAHAFDQKRGGELCWSGPAYLRVAGDEAYAAGFAYRGGQLTLTTGEPRVTMRLGCASEASLCISRSMEAANPNHQTVTVQKVQIARGESVQVSLIVCTRNRASRLPYFLERLCSLESPRNSWELIWSIMHRLTALEM